MADTKTVTLTTKSDKVNLGNGTNFVLGKGTDTLVISGAGSLENPVGLDREPSQICWSSTWRHFRSEISRD